MTKSKQWMAAGATSLALAMAGMGSAGAQQKELRIAYQPNPIQEASIDMMIKWGKANDVKIVKVPNSYGVYVEKMTASLTSGSDQYDVIWNNDDWGQLWAHMLEPVDDVQGLELADTWGIDPIIFDNAEGKPTTVPLAHASAVLFYRSDLVKEDEVPRTWEELVAVSKKLQSEGKVKYGYVGGMAMNSTWFSWFWSMWGNDCDVLLPALERDNAVLAKNGWKSGMDQPCMRQVVEFWWDAINKDKIVPSGMPAYGRNEANALFTSGDAAFTVADSVYWADFNDASKSKVSGKIDISYLPIGPNRSEPFAWNDIWGWSIPKSIPAERKALAKKMLSDMMRDDEGQVALWEKTGAPPPNKELWDRIAQTDTLMQKMKKYVLDVPTKVHAAYYFPEWPAVHKAYSDAMIKAVTGSRDDIPKALAEGAANVHKAAGN